MSNLGGGAFNGISPKQTINNFKTNDDVRIRRTVVRAWNTNYTNGTYNGKNRAIGEFRAVNNLGDFLSRSHYNCGGLNPENAKRPGYARFIGSMFQNCDGSGVPPSTCNTKYIPDSSDYIKYRKQRAVNKTYNDSTFGGDQSHASYKAIMSVRRI